MFAGLSHYGCRLKWIISEAQMGLFRLLALVGSMLTHVRVFA